MKLIQMPKAISKQIHPLGYMGGQLINYTGEPYYGWNGTLRKIDRGMFLFSCQLPMPGEKSRWDYIAEIV